MARPLIEPPVAARAVPFSLQSVRVNISRNEIAAKCGVDVCCEVIVIHTPTILQEVEISSDYANISLIRESTS
jgi:hypothetical protein